MLCPLSTLSNTHTLQVIDKDLHERDEIIGSTVIQLPPGRGSVTYEYALTTSSGTAAGFIAVSIFLQYDDAPVLPVTAPSPPLAPPLTPVTKAANKVCPFLSTLLPTGALECSCSPVPAPCGPPPPPRATACRLMGCI